MDHDQQSPRPPAADLAGLLRSHRSQALLTQEELAERSGLAVTTIRGLESGRIRRPRSASVRLLAVALGLSEADRAALVAAALGVPADSPPEAANSHPHAAERDAASDCDSLYDVARAASAAPTVPAQLPRVPPAFTGRVADLRELDEALHEAAESGTSIVAISGMAGVGKTTLATHWAHQVADWFPDGQLYVNLRAFAPGQSPMAADDALRDILDALLVRPERVPATPTARSGLYRSLLADRRMLIVLDNAHSSEQVRPLLPGARGCFVVVTSRDRLTGLIAVDGARPLALDVLTDGEAHDLVTQRIGVQRSAAEPAMVEEIINRCGGLPLALVVVAARVASQPRFPLKIVAAELRTSANVLDSLSEPDGAADLRALFSWSYQDLDEDAARMFRMLGLHPGPEISVPAAASLAGMSTTQARAALARLHRGSLVLELTPGRYALHDLLRRYAIELHLRHDGAEDRHDATRRMLDHYTHAAYAAARQLTPHRPTVSFPPTAPDNPETIDRPDVAVAWFRAEQPVLQSLVQRTEAAGFHSHTWLLAWSLRDFYHQQGHWRHMQAVHEAALDAAEHLQDKPRAAYAHRTLGIALGRLGRFDSAGDHLAKALELSSSVSDYAGMASAENCLIEIAIASGHSEAAAEYAQQALIHFQMAGDRRGEMHALNGLAWASLHLGAHEDALRYGERALAVLEEVAGAHAGFAHIFANLGHAHHGLGEHPQAISNLQQALSLAQEVDDQPLEAEILVAMGDLHHAVGDDCQARDAWCRAERILRTFGDPGADDVLAKLVRE